MASGGGEQTVVGLVLAGGGARGAYEIGALSALLPALEERGERPRVIVGTSVGALNAAYLAATAEQPVERVVREARAIWSEIGFEEVLEPVVSPKALARLARYLGQFLGVPRVRLEAFMDPAPLRDTVRRLVPFEQLERNVADGVLRAAAVVATSPLSTRSVVFHRGGDPPQRDEKRGIDYVAAALTDEHVRASAAIPGVFPAVHVGSPEHARGWYFDGGTRLNTPIKPVLALGAERVVVVALNSIAAAPGAIAGESRPDAFEGVSQFVQAVLVDPLAHDVQTLTTVNELLPAEDGGTDGAGKQRVPYVFIAPRERQAVGEIAMRVFRDHYSKAPLAAGSRDLAFLGRAVAGGSDPLHGDLLSYLLFAPEFARELLELGRTDAERWLSQQHDDGPWETGPLPLPG
jgi:NTE family protein